MAKGWKKTGEEKYKGQVNRLTEKIKEAIITGDCQKYDEIVDSLSNSLNSDSRELSKEVLIDVFCNVICWIIQNENIIEHEKNQLGLGNKIL